MKNYSFYLSDIDADTSLKNASSIAVDGEFGGLDPKSDKLHLLQLCDGSDFVHLVKFEKNYDAPNLKKILENERSFEIEKKIIKPKLKFDIIIEDAGHYLKDQIITLFMLFECLKTNGIFVIEELDFPDTRKDMNIFDEKPTLREILLAIKNKKDFESKYVSVQQKKYFLENLGEINIFKGAHNEIAFITKK